MSFNQISGKVHGRHFKLKRTERQNSQLKIPPFHQQSDLVSEFDTLRESELIDDSPIKKTSVYTLPSMRKQSQSKIQLLSLQNSGKNKAFFNQVHLQSNPTLQNALSPVIQSGFSIKMPKKLSLKRSDIKTQQHQQSIIFNYLNQKIPIKLSKKKKKKKLLSKSAQKQSRPPIIYIFPSSDPKIHRRQKTEFKMPKSPKLELGSILQKRRSLDSSNQRNLMIIRRQAQTLNKQERLLDQLRKRVSEVETYQKSLNKLPLEKIQLNLSRKKYSFSNRTMENEEPSYDEERERFKYEPQSSYVEESSGVSEKESSKVLKTIQKTSKNLKTLKVVTEKKQSPTNLERSLVQLLEKQSNIPKNEDLVETIKYNYREQKSSEQSEEPELDEESQPESQSSQAKDEVLKQERIKEDNFGQQSKIQVRVQTPIQLIQPEVLVRPKRFSPPKNNLTQPLRIPDKSFLRIKTYYAQTLINPKIPNRSTSLASSLPQTMIIKQIPYKDQITKFIEKYTPSNPIIEIPKLISSENFEVVLEEKKQLYFGQIAEKLKSGLGVTVRHNYVYEGIYQKGLKVKGFQITERGKYKGEFKNQKKEGKGKFQWKNGETYDGQWMDGKKHGHGTWQAQNGDTYVGQWDNGKVQGHGIHTSATGQRYEGSFYEFLKSGWGNEHLPNGDIYQGQFSDGKPNGAGKYTWKDGQEFKGQFKAGFRTGYGTLKDLKGNLYRGEFQKQEATGKCEINFANEDSFYGYVQKGIFNGQGVLTLYEEQQIWKGLWIDEIFFKDQGKKT